MEEKKPAMNRALRTAAGCLVAAALAVLVWQILLHAFPQKSDEAKTIEVQVIHGDGSDKTFTLETEAENLGEALVEGKVVEDNQSTYGLYILTADGETVDESNEEWWMITKDGESLNTGADSTTIADGEHYELTFTVGYDMPSDDGENTDAAENADAAGITIEVQVIHGDGSDKTFTLTTEKETLGEALVEGEVVENNQSTYGLYILTADGETVDESNQEWWMITKDGESLNTGADSTPIADGEHYELTFTVGY